jgi:hypothetical protein
MWSRHCGEPECSTIGLAISYRVGGVWDVHAHKRCKSARALYSALGQHIQSTIDDTERAQSEHRLNLSEPAHTHKTV